MGRGWATVFNNLRCYIFLSAGWHSPCYDCDMNCINCGAAPKARSTTCTYCGTGLRTIKQEADTHLFKPALENFKNCDYDESRIRIAQSFPRLGAKFTAGQVRALAEECDYDDSKLDIFRTLLPCTLNPIQLLDASDIFDYDESREAVFEMLVKAKVALDAEDRDRVTYARARAEDIEPVPAPAPKTEGRNLALTQAVWLILVVLAAEYIFRAYLSG
jgi:hypothetical protein